MPSVSDQLVALTIAILAFAASLASSTTSDGSDGFIFLGRRDSTKRIWTDPVPGTRPLFGIQERVLNVGRRDCLANGSNYCFGNNADHCPGCGNCCIQGKFCCGGGRTCCGTGCCTSDQTCSGGKCLSSVAPVIITSTISETATRIATQRVTIVVAEVEISTAVSTIDVTISTAATQTDVVWVTSTAFAKRAVASPNAAQLGKRDTSTVAPNPDLSGGAAIERREPTREGSLQTHRDIIPAPRQASPEMAPTVTNVVTHTVAVTSVSSVFITAHTTSMTVTTIYQTNTRVLKAETTLTLTSTFTATSHPPTIITLTTTADLIPPLTTSLPTPTIPSSQPSETSPPDPQPLLSMPAIAGIATGSSILSALLTLFVILSVRKRRRRRRLGRLSGCETPPPLDHTHRYRRSDEDTMMWCGRREPKLPSVLPHFATTAYPAHHDAQFQPPPPPTTTTTTATTPEGGGGCRLTAGSAARRMGHQHQRNSSGLTTLVGTPSPTTGGGFGVGVGSAPALGPWGNVDEETWNRIAEVEGNAVAELGGDGIVAGKVLGEDSATEGER
ncbi:hypothetical protein VTI74DRAFT_2983 [Chaetomium olivicolor]